MVVTSAKPIIRQAVAEFVGRITGEYVSELQAGYLADQSWAVASLAQLRRGAGKLPQDVPELWGMVGAERLFADETLPETEALRAEAAMFLAVTLYALHQQSQAEPMYRPGEELGKAVRRLMGDEIDEPIRRRFVRVGTAATRDALATRLREIITLLRRDAIPLDYGLLAEQLYLAQTPDGLRQVRQRWGRSFHAHRADSASPGDSPTTGKETTSSDKEAA